MKSSNDDVNIGTSKGTHIPVGRISGVHGVKGELKVVPYVDAEVFDFKTLFIEGDDDRALKVIRTRPHKSGFLVVVEGVGDRDEAKALVGDELTVPRDELPVLDEDEYYHSDLIGMEVWTDDEMLLGRIKDVITTGGNDVYEVHGPMGEVLIPAITNVVIRIDKEAGKVTVHLMEGLLPDQDEV